jgi:hypothetical protein
VRNVQRTSFAARDWMAAQAADLLPVEYFHVVFTLPAEIAQIAQIAYWNKKAVYDLLFRASAETLTTIAADPKRPVRTHRHDQRAAHLGIGADASPACSHYRAWRGTVAGRHPLDRLLPRVPGRHPSQPVQREDMTLLYFPSRAPGRP